MDQPNFPNPSPLGDESAIAIIGMSCRFAGARGLDAYWNLLRDGREAIERYGDEDLLKAGVAPALLRNSNYVRAGAPLEDMECFDAGLFGLSPRDAAIMDPQHRHFLECTWEAFENAGHVPQRFPGVIGVFAGSGHNAYMPYNLLSNDKLTRDVGLFLLRHTGNDKDFLSTRASYLFDLKGPSINLQTACSTSLVAIHMAMQSLLNGECDLALAGGASIDLPHRQGYLYQEGEILSPDGHCRPFDASAQGTVFGSGIGVLALRRLQDAVADGDHIYAVLRGSAVNNDGAGKVGYLAPSVDGQAKVIAEALAIAGVEADTIDYVEAHGTGTPVGDPIEVAALTEAFRRTTDKVGYCGLGSVKSSIGHTDTAAGAAGVIKVALAMHHGELPATLNFTAPNPACDLDRSPFHVQSARAPWQQEAGRPRRASVSSLGVGGTNAHVVMEQAPMRRSSGPGRGHELFVLSAKSQSGLAGTASALVAHLAAPHDGSPADVAYTLATGRQPLPLRRFVVAADAAQAARSLANPAEAIEAKPDRKVAFLFCGAGPQHVDMARGLYDTEPLFRAEVDNALTVHHRVTGKDIRDVLLPAAEGREAAAERLQRPSVALPALFIVQTALARLWISMGIDPTAGMIGHSSGEYAAAHISGVIDLEAGLRIVSERGRLFETTAAGGMLSVPLSADELKPMLPSDLSIAAINAPQLCVVSGDAEAISRFQHSMQEREIETQRVRIDVAAHSVLLDPILPAFRELMRSIRLNPPTTPFVSNLDGGWATAQRVTDPEYWVEHLRGTVRFTDGVAFLLEDQDCVLLEVGPGRAMASLVRQHPARSRNQPIVSSLPHPEQGVADDAFWLSAAGQLWATGAPLDWERFWGGQDRLRLPLPTYRFDRERHWIEPGARSSAEPAGDPGERRADPADWQFEPVWHRAALSPADGQGGAALILDDRGGLGAGIAECLRAEGRRAILVRHSRRFRRFSADAFGINPLNRCDFARLLDSLSNEDALPGQVYHCWRATAKDGRGPRIEKELELGLYSLASLAPELARQLGDAPVEVAIVTSHAQRIAGEGGLLPSKAALAAAARVVATEFPTLRLRTIDVDMPPPGAKRLVAPLAALLVAELGSAWERRSIAYRGGERWVQHYAPSFGTSEQAADALETANSGSFFITGGLGGLGLTIARHLAERQGARIALVSRSSMPPRATWQNLLARKLVDDVTEQRLRSLMALEASGATIELIQADVTNTRQMRLAVQRAVAVLGPIDTAFHTAGMLDDGLLEVQSRSEMAAVLAPKIAGTMALDAALSGHRVRHLLLFSSVSAIAGMPGQAAYAAANAFVDAYAQSRRCDPVTRVTSLGWCRWREVGMAAALGATGPSVSDLPEDLGAWEAVDHPILEQLHEVSADEFVVTATLSPEQHWLLDEHRVAELGPVLPGTAYLELARAAHDLIDPGPVVLSEVTFLTPFVVPDGTARELRVHMRRRVGTDWRFVVLGRALAAADARANDWVEHASGLCAARTAIEPAARQLDDALDEQWPAFTAGQPSFVLRFGERWNVVESAKGRHFEALLRLSLADRFRDECDQLSLHPALLDIAIAGAQPLIGSYDPARDFFAPFSFRRIVVHAPLPSRIVSHVRLRPGDEASASSAVFDVAIYNSDRQIVAEIDGFTMMRIRELSAMDGFSPPIVDGEFDGQRAMLEGIRPDEGLKILDSVRTGRPRPHVIVSPYELDGLLAALRKPPRRSRLAIDRDVGEVAAMPASPMEQVIAEIWSDLLGVSPVLRTDNFFDLGGHSLLAVQFANRLRKRTGRTLALAALMDTPTVAALAATINPEGAGAPAADAPPVSAVPTRQLVTIKSGGALPPLFFVHDGLGETLLYRGLALRLDQARSVYGIEPVRNADGTFAHTRISEMASNYVTRIKTIQPDGPYLLAGLCAGGVIAFEMAQQLQDAGEHVAFVGIIDAADVALRKRPFYTTRVRLRRLRALASQAGVTTLAPAIAERLVNTVRWEISSRLDRARDRRLVKAMRDEGSPGAKAAQVPAMPFLKLYEVAHRLHRPTGVLNGTSVALFRATRGSGEKDDVPYADLYGDLVLGWGRRVSNAITVLPVPGGHSSALQEPNVDKLAHCFQEALDCVTAWDGCSIASVGQERDETSFAVAAE